MTAYVSNGNGTPRVLEFLRPWIDLYKVDLKSFDDKQYRKLGGRLQPILETIRELHARGLWLEIVTLLIPGFNDSESEITRLTEFLASVSVDIPWHVTAFHQDYRMRDPMDTTAPQLVAAAALGKRAGLRYAYAGNLPGMVGGLEDTHCASCGSLLIERFGYHIRGYHLTADGRCGSCHATVPGRWDHAFAGQITSHPFVPHDRTRLRVI
jgi:pyruvate formate lyase activating enzyme